jgi:mannose-6-phosphate isomerase-like protein (cupin superfamily)
MDKAKVETDWQQRGFSCAIWIDPPRQVWSNYVHSVDELVMLIEGEIELSFQGKTLRPEVGEEILIPAGVSHTVRNIGKTTNRWFYGYKRS